MKSRCKSFNSCIYIYIYYNSYDLIIEILESFMEYYGVTGRNSHYNGYDYGYI